MSNPEFPDPARGGPHRSPQFGAVPPPPGYGAPMPPGYGVPPPPGYGYGYGAPPPPRANQGRIALWIVGGFAAFIAVLIAVGVVLSPPNTPLCRAYRDLNGAMDDNPYFNDVTAELDALSEIALADPDPGVRSDGEKLDEMGMFFDSDDVAEKTTNIAEKC